MLKLTNPLLTGANPKPFPFLGLVQSAGVTSDALTMIGEHNQNQADADNPQNPAPPIVNPVFETNFGIRCRILQPQPAGFDHSRFAHFFFMPIILAGIEKDGEHKQANSQQKQDNHTPPPKVNLLEI
jgi:hypothetical protein